MAKKPSHMTGDEFRIAIRELYGTEETTKRAADGLGIARRTVQLLCARAHVPLAFERMIQSERRARRIDASEHALLLADLRLTAVRLSVAAKATVMHGEDGSTTITFPATAKP